MLNSYCHYSCSMHACKYLYRFLTHTHMLYREGIIYPLIQYTILEHNNNTFQLYGLTICNNISQTYYGFFSSLFFIYRTYFSLKKKLASPLLLQQNILSVFSQVLLLMAAIQGRYQAMFCVLPDPLHRTVTLFQFLIEGFESSRISHLRYEDVLSFVCLL